jgi:hypothetical protein
VVSATERRTVVVALGAVLVLAATEVVVSTITNAVRYKPTALEQTIRCLRFEKGLEVSTLSRDPIARTADRGTLSTVVEGNPVTVAISSDEEGAARLSALYERVAGNLGTRLERRGKIVYVFDGEPSPTQRQALYDCAYS